MTSWLRGLIGPYLTCWLQWRKTSIHLEISPLQGDLHIQFEHSLLSGFSPFFLMFGSQAQLPLNLMHRIGQQEEMSTTEYARNLKQSLEEAYALEQTKHSVQHERRKAIYDQKTHNNLYENGNLAWLNFPAVGHGESRKLHHIWKGPF